MGIRCRACLRTTDAESRSQGRDKESRYQARRENWSSSTWVLESDVQLACWHQTEGENDEKKKKKKLEATRCQHGVPSNWNLVAHVRGQQIHVPLPQVPGYSRTLEVVLTSPVLGSQKRVLPTAYRVRDKPTLKRCSVRGTRYGSPEGSRIETLQGVYPSAHVCISG